jgi:hypothetical protein
MGRQRKKKKKASGVTTFAFNNNRVRIFFAQIGMQFFLFDNHITSLIKIGRDNEF